MEFQSSKRWFVTKTLQETFTQKVMQQAVPRLRVAQVALHQKLNRACVHVARALRQPQRRARHLLAHLRADVAC